MIILRRSDTVIKHEILGSLILSGPLKLNHIACKANVDCIKLKRLLRFLIKDEYVIEKSVSKDCLYLITTKGLHSFRELQKKPYIPS
jgi:predicted transcriptional regulator